MKKFYIRINGELMEVDYRVYREYYYGKRKEKYFMFDLKWRSEEHTSELQSPS